MSKVHDLRSAIEFLETVPGQMLTSDTEVDPNAEVSGVYRHVGAGGTVARPTKEGPAMLFNNIKGFPGTRVSIGMLSSRKRVGMLLDTDPEFLGKYMGEKLKETIPPVMIPEENTSTARKSYIMQPIRILICAHSFRHRQTHQKMRVHTLLWDFAWEPIRKMEPVM